jgi:tRNA threonylcarbamoyladenosine biosynthesis protein TsaE
MPDRWTAALGGTAFEIQDLKTVANELLNATKKRVWLMNGEMGAGKTTLIKAICEQLGVMGGMSSPTFSIVNQYDTTDHQTIYHFDFYRLKNEGEALDIGVEEYLESGNFCFLEWPEKISHLMPSDIFKVNIKQNTPTTRTVEYLAND